MVCTFFGHRDVTSDVEMHLKKLVVELITQKSVTEFYVGNEGNFDRIVRRVLHELSEAYAHIRYAVVLAYRPTKRQDDGDYSDTIYPQEVAIVPPRVAIPVRNAWMIDRADYVVTYVCRHGGAARWQQEAEKKGKTVIRLTDLQERRSIVMP